jgi:hypothetical protein
MEELLQKLLEAEVLSEETKKDLESAFQKKLDEAESAAKEEAAADVRAELTEQWVTERDQLIEAVDSKVTEFLAKEVEELKEDIERFRDLEAEYAEKLVEAKASMSDELKDDLMELVEKVDAFLEIRLSAEIEELREDLDAVRKNDFGRRVFEAFADEFMVNYADEDSAESTLRETTERLRDTEEALAESEEKRKEIERQIAMEQVLSPLGGRQREVMEAILRNVDTEHLEEGYKTFIGRVIRETSEKEDSVLAESKKEKEEDDDDDDDDDDMKSKKSKKSEKDDDDEKDEDIKEGVTVTGDKEEVIMEESDPAVQSQIAYYKKLAGIE